MSQQGQLTEHLSREMLSKRDVRDLDPAPIPDGISAAEAREGLRIAYGGDAHQDMRGPLLATDAEIRACGRLIAKEVTQ